MVKNKKAFTLAEGVITITIIGVVAAILLPVIQKANPDKDALVYKKAIYAMQRGVQKYMESPKYVDDMNAAKTQLGNEVFSEGNVLANLTGTTICNGLADQLNTRGAISCGSVGSYDSPNFVTVDGIKYWGFGGNNLDRFNLKTSRITIYAESVETPSAGTLKKRVNWTGHNKTNRGLRMYLSYLGKIAPVEKVNANSGSKTYEQTLLQDFTKLKN